MTSCPSIVTSTRALDRHEHALEREAALVGGLRRARALRDLGIDDRRHVLVVGELEDEQALEHADLRRREPDAARVVHQVRHLLGEPRQVVVELLDLARPHPQDGVRVLADLRERDAAARVVLRVELPLVDLVSALGCGTDAALRHARECSQSDCGSTSTTRVDAGAAHRGRRARRAAGPRRARERRGLAARGVRLRHELSAVAAAQAEQRRRSEQVGALQLAVRARAGAASGAAASVPEATIEIRCRNGG